MLKTIWKIMIFQFYTELPNIGYVAIALALWTLVLLAVILISLLTWRLAYTIYRVVAYDYKIETLQAKVTGKHIEEGYLMMADNTAIRHSDEHDVYFDTIEYGLYGAIDSEELYNWAQEGARFDVIMKIGRSRKGDRKIKYWRVINCP